MDLCCPARPAAAGEARAAGGLCMCSGQPAETADRADDTARADRRTGGDREEDLRLVELCRLGDDSAFGALVEKYRDRALGVAYSVLRNYDEALDVSQDAFVKAYTSLDGFRGQSAFGTWLHRIVVNMAIDRRRRLSRTAAAEYNDAIDVGDRAELALGSAPDSPADVAVGRELAETVDAVLARLPDEQRTIVVLREMEGMSYREIAAAVGCSPGTVMSRLHYARKRLRRLLEMEGWF